MSTPSDKSITLWLEDALSTINRTVSSVWTFSSPIVSSVTGNITGNVTGDVTGAVVIPSVQPTAGSGAGITVNYTGKSITGWYKVSLAKEAWTAAAQTQDITLCTIPAKARILAAYANTTVAYAGLAGTIALKVGSTTGGDEVLASHDVKTAVITAGLLDAEMGTALVRSAAIQGGYVPSFSATTAIKARLTSGTGNIGAAGVTNLTFGATTLYLKLEAL